MTASRAVSTDVITADLDSNPIVGIVFLLLWAKVIDCCNEKESEVHVRSV